MQSDSGARRILKVPFVYSTFQTLVGAKRCRRWFLETGVRPRPGMRLVDIGCGPGDILDDLPSLEYVGVDISAPYIEDARAHYGDRGHFIVGTAASLTTEPKAQSADTVMCLGVLHHLSDDDAREVLDVAERILRVGGRFVALEPCYLLHQTGLSRWFLSRDRGQAVRTEEAWKALARSSKLRQVETHVTTGLLRLPYTHVLLECTKVGDQSSAAAPR